VSERTPLPPPFSRPSPVLRRARAHSEEGLPAFEELFLYACPKFIAANPPPYDDADALQAHLDDPAAGAEPAQRHLAAFLADVRAQGAVPTLRSFLKLYTSLDARKLSRCVSTSLCPRYRARADAGRSWATASLTRTRRTWCSR
jgi:hypothetical protein